MPPVGGLGRCFRLLAGVGDPRDRSSRVFVALAESMGGHRSGCEQLRSAVEVAKRVVDGKKRGAYTTAINEALDVGPSAQKAIRALEIVGE